MSETNNPDNYPFLDDWLRRQSEPLPEIQPKTACRRRIRRQRPAAQEKHTATGNTPKRKKNRLF